MFPAFFAQDDGHRRRLFVGNVPVGRREAYQGAASNAAPSPAPAGFETAQERARRLGTLDPRVVLFQMQVVGPWKAMVNLVMRPGPTGASVNPDDAQTLRDARLDRAFAAEADNSLNRRVAVAETLRAERDDVADLIVVPAARHVPVPVEASAVVLGRGTTVRARFRIA